MNVSTIKQTEQVMKQYFGVERIKKGGGMFVVKAMKREVKTSGEN